MDVASGCSVTDVCKRYLRHSVTNGWCMFCFITFKYIFIFKGDKGEILIYFYGCSDFKLHFRSLAHWLAFYRTQFLRAPFVFFSLFTVKVLPGENKDLFFAPLSDVPSEPWRSSTCESNDLKQKCRSHLNIYSVKSWIHSFVSFFFYYT